MSAGFVLAVRIRLTRDPYFDWSLDRIRLELTEGDACARHFPAQGGLQWSDDLREWVPCR